MRIVHAVEEMQRLADEKRRERRSIGLVPTMGYLHEGHLSLVREARRNDDIVVTSIYVNPTQFGPSEDLERYPRDIDRDQKLLEAEENDILFYPENSAMYPTGFQTEVRVTELTRYHCGASRPWHFPGVALIVAKLFNMVKPNVAYFGQKDYQQAQVIRRMVEDLNFDIRIETCPIVREAGGLAMSSRNAYLTSEERKQALSLSEALKLANTAFSRGEREAETLRGTMKERIERNELAEIDYVEVADPETLEPLQGRVEKGVALLAVHFGKTRLIDNHILGTPISF